MCTSLLGLLSTQEASYAALEVLVQHSIGLAPFALAAAHGAVRDGLGLAHLVHGHARHVVDAGGVVRASGTVVEVYES